MLGIRGRKKVLSYTNIYNKEKHIYKYLKETEKVESKNVSNEKEYSHFS